MTGAGVTFQDGEMRVNDQTCQRSRSLTRLLFWAIIVDKIQAKTGEGKIIMDIEVDQAVPETDSKGVVIEGFLKFIAQFLDLPKARLATLGGYGQEATIWQKHQIPKENGWLIEKQRRLSKALIKDLPFHYCNSLEGFATILQSFGETNSSIDGFHLDLCGEVLDDDLEAYKSLVDLIARSTGKCLAITVADQRRSKALENFSRIGKDLKKFLGVTSFKNLYTELRTEQSGIPPTKNLPSFFTKADPDKGVKRELGIFDSLIKLLTVNGKIALIPDQVIRYIYRSNYSGRGFRMRTYIFHLKVLSEPISIQTAAQQMMRHWLASELTMVTENQIIKISGKRKEIQKMKKKPTTKINTQDLESQFPLMTQVMELSSPAVKAEYRALLKLVKAGVRAESGAEALLAQIQNSIANFQDSKPQEPKVTTVSKSSSKKNRSRSNYCGHTSGQQ